mmetsp:Transcript_15103/g.18414  ORF Transcript_15103/g.18414 Transcript_15103/m.18414 type:complete len:83 (-) Transcript_15103:47-295(-)
MARKTSSSKKKNRSKTLISTVDKHDLKTKARPQQNEMSCNESTHKSINEDEICNCFLRRGQMFLPPNLLKKNDFIEDEDGKR